MINLIRKYLSTITLVYLNFKWRKRNKHNYTVLVNKVDFNIVNVGKGSYGELNIKSFNSVKEKISIGNYVSIAENVVFLLGGNHNYNYFSTYPFKFYRKGEIEAETKGQITINDDVWIGYNSTILSGIEIGQGAVIAAGSIVTKDVLPYSIVAGNPAKLIKYRFNSDEIDRLKKINYNKVDKNFIDKNLDLLYKEVNSKNIDKLANFINDYSLEKY